MAKAGKPFPLWSPLCPHGLQAQPDCTAYSRPCRFRAMLMQWMTAIAPASPKFRRIVQVSGQCLELRGEDCQ